MTDAVESAQRPAWSCREAREYDRTAIGRFGIPGILLMENAARGCALAAREMLGDAGGAVFVCCGPGQNGGDGYAIARMLAGWGIEIGIFALGAPPEASDAGVMRGIAMRLGLPVHPIEELAARAAGRRPALVVDALFGTGLARPLEGDALRAVRAINACGARVLAVDLPSGLDGDLGEPRPECVRADLTVTMVARKTGLCAPGASRWTGACRVVDVGGPAVSDARPATR